ncbi:MAG: chromosomal replication initiator protein DnaA [Bacteroidales bacterium]|nr:chromosomal replication initiator protein DnaA [Bacteroidales bacterium]
MDQERHVKVWNACLRIFEQILEPQQYSTWFKPIRPVAIENATITVEVPSEFFREYLEEYFLDVIQKVLHRELGAEARLNYMVRPVTAQPALTYPAAHGNAPVNRTITVPTYSPNSNPGPFVYPGTHRVQVNPQLNPVYCFDNLVRGECNRMGITAGESISQNPGKTAFNPLLLFGGPGLGKTHIAQAIGIAVKEKYPELVVIYVTANRFKTQYMDAVAKNRLTDFLAFYMKMDVLIVDDIQELSTPGTQNAFFHVFNSLHQNGKQLIFTSDRPPVELQNFENRLLSRLKWGLSVELSKPDYNTRLAMLKARSFREGISLSEDVLVFLATRIRSNFREMEGALISLIANATFAHKEATVELAEKVTEKIVGEQRTELTIDMIQNAVCDYFNITREDLVSKSRKREIVQARQIAMYLSRNHINCSFSTIGSEIGGKDHATVVHACGIVSDLMSTDRTFRQYVNDIEKILVSI